MSRLLLIFILFLFCDSVVKAQTLKLTCNEKQKKNEFETYPIIIKTCFIKGFKFILTSYPDYAGRYFYSENEVFEKIRKRYVSTKNSKVFNNRQGDLISLINNRIKKDFAIYKANNDVNECLSEIESVPEYGMDDLQISFYQDEIWFGVHWGLSGACRSVGGTIISFKLNEISKYLN